MQKQPALPQMIYTLKFKLMTRLITPNGQTELLEIDPEL